MSELAHAPECAPAPPRPAWLPTPDQLLSHPLEKAYAIDPKDPVEVDDAIKTEHRSATEHRVAVFISDIGLIEGEGEALDLARARGWTRYAEKPGEKTVTMFDASIYEPLGLDQRHFGIGAPAIKISFSVNPITGSWGEADFGKATVKTSAYTYGSVDKMVAIGPGRLSDLVATSNAIARALGNPNSIGSAGSASRETVARFMVMANFVAAEEMERRSVPWLYRNHGLAAIEQIRHISDEHRELFRKFMKAIYHTDPVEHAGLGLEAYCHLTSGLRRFPDTANGLNLNALIEGRDPVYEYEEMCEISDEMTEIYRKEMVRRPPKAIQKRRAA